MKLFDRPLRRLCVRCGWTALLEWRWRVRPLAILLRPGTSLLGCALAFALRRRERFLHGLLLHMLAHYGVPRLVTVILAVQRLLLRRLGIAGP